jgi:hypothetical protein
MKYYKFVSVDDIVRRLSDEIINASYNKKYYVNEILQKNPEEEYNTFTNKGIIYNFEIQSGIIFLLIEKCYIINVFTKLKDAIEKKVNMIISAGIEIADYQLMHAEQKESHCYKNNSILKEKIFKHITIQIQNSSSTLNHEITKSIDWYIRITYDCDHNNLLNATNIIVDGHEIFNLENEHRALNNFTKFDTYLNANNKYCVIEHYSNLRCSKNYTNFDHYLLTKYIVSSVKNPLNILYKINIKRKFIINNEKLFNGPNGPFWIRYDETNLINFQINMLDLKYISIDKLSKFNHKINKLCCAVTGIPIYDDFYIIDIYEQIIVADNKNLDYEKLGYEKLDGIYQKTLKYDKPMHLAISPIVLCSIQNIQMQFNLLNIKYIVYRTKYNKNIHDIIDDFDLNLAHKRILHSDVNFDKNSKYNFKYTINNINKGLISKSFAQYKDIICDRVY